MLSSIQNILLIFWTISSQMDSILTISSLWSKRSSLSTFNDGNTMQTINPMIYPKYLILITTILITGIHQLFAICLFNIIKIFCHSNINIIEQIDQNMINMYDY
ncbi:hypothetical protein DERP_009158 [Dermatophagoides pteronyssinus]|uniref:Uncharacterized protein n=1 Tax=Dermatophagoides pteronyssinus TaxID=6956 RepID=A0ABQ8JR71_DERPT|nr:hypothetical protein DERP_009158 [Dermatophagoides pteronyssinus]